jgi:hypothetical protein
VNGTMCRATGDAASNDQDLCIIAGNGLITVDEIAMVVQFTQETCHPPCDHRWILRRKTVFGTG